MNNAEKNHKIMDVTDNQQLNCILAPVKADFIKSYAAALHKECADARTFMDSFDFTNAGSYAAQPYYKAQRKWWALTGKNYERMALAAWNKRVDTLSKGIQRTGVQVDKLKSGEAGPSAADFRMSLSDCNGNSCCARAILVYGTEKRPHMRFICT